MLCIYELETCYRSLLIASVKDQANIIIIEEYRKILGNCGCAICTVCKEVDLIDSVDWQQIITVVK